MLIPIPILITPICLIPSHHARNNGHNNQESQDDWVEDKDCNFCDNHNATLTEVGFYMKMIFHSHPRPPRHG